MELVRVAIIIVNMQMVNRVQRRHLSSHVLVRTTELYYENENWESEVGRVPVITPPLSVSIRSTGPVKRPHLQYRTTPRGMN